MIFRRNWKLKCQVLSWMAPALYFSYSHIFLLIFASHTTAPTASIAALSHCQCSSLTSSALHTARQTSSFPPPVCHSVYPLLPQPPCLVLGNSTRIHPQSPTNPHTLQQHTAAKPSSVFFVRKRIWLVSNECATVFTGVCVSVCLHLQVHVAVHVCQSRWYKVEHVRNDWELSAWCH